MTVCVRCWVSGRVQGVWYRATTRRQAQALGLDGYAHNLADGRVEVLACGSQAQVQKLRDWLWEGPSGADVRTVDCEPAPGTVAPQGFSVG